MKNYFPQSFVRNLILKISYYKFQLKTTLLYIAFLFLFSSTSHFQNLSRLDHTSARKSYSTAFGYLKLNLNSNSSNYNTEIFFNTNATQGLDPGYDSSIIGETIPAFSIYSFLVQDNTGVPFAIQTLSETDITNVSIPIGISASQGQELTVSISETDISESINIYFENASNNFSTLLNNNNYEFTFDSNLQGIGNFYLRFEGGALNYVRHELDKLEIYMNSFQKTLFIKGKLSNETEFNLYDVHGRIVIVKMLDILTSNRFISTSQLKNGIYIAELISKGKQKRIQKLIIQ